MSIAYNAREVYEMAIQVERNGAAFYRKAAKRLSDRGVCATLHELADMEDVHQKTFEAMLAVLNEGNDQEEQWSDPEVEALRYLQAFAGGHVFDITADPSAELSDSIGPGEVLMMAVGKERDSIMFFLGLRDLASGSADRDRIDGIIKEEMGHVTVLLDQIELYGGA